MIAVVIKIVPKNIVKKTADILPIEEVNKANLNLVKNLALALLFLITLVNFESRETEIFLIKAIGF